MTCEKILCNVDNLTDGSFKDFDVEEDGKKILLIKDDGQFYAVGNKCTHYGAPLNKGSYCSGRVRCPWHGASFSVETGDIEDFPGLDSLPKFETKIKDNQVVLLYKKEDLETHKRVKQMCNGNKDTKPGVVIIGGGAAAVTCAETLRQENFEESIIILSQEEALPYDRPKLSKAADIPVENMYLRPPEFYEKFGIDVQLNKKVTNVDFDGKTVKTADGSSVSYKHLVIATGGTPRKLTCPGADLENVCYLRTPSDGKKLTKNVEGKNVVVIGSSFIGMELAAFAKQKKAVSVTVIGPSQVPFENIFGKDVGAALQKIHESNGVKFCLNSGVKELRGIDGKLKEVVLSDDTVLPADLCIAGIGVLPSTDFLKDTNLALNDRGFIPVDACMRTINKQDVYACGDIVTFPLYAFGVEHANVQHFQMALKHGKTAGLTIAGKPEQIDSIPFFWSVMFGKSLRYTGYGPGYDDIKIHGDLDELKFVAYYFKNSKLRAVATLGMDPVAAQIAECFRTRKIITKTDVENNYIDNWGMK